MSSPELRSAHFVAADGAVLPVRTWIPRQEPPKTVVVALHGFNDYSRAFEMPGNYLSHHGIAVYAYDQRGFGHGPGRGFWPGTEALTDDLRQVVIAVTHKHPGVPAYVMGESMGAAVAIVAMTSPQPLPVHGLILSAPAVWSRETMPWYQRLLLSMTAHTVPWLKLTGASLEILASDNIDMLRALGRDPLVIKETRVDAIYGLANLMDRAFAQTAALRGPLLVLYGQRDQVVPKQPIQRMLARLTNGASTRVAFYEQGHHLLLRDLQAEQPWQDIAAWVSDQKQPLPSGADRRVALLRAGRTGPS